MNSPTAKVLEGLKVYGKEALRSDAQLHWARLVAWYKPEGVRRRGGPRTPKVRLSEAEKLRLYADIA